MRVVALAGARQTGKTTLARVLAGDGAEYRSLDNEDQLISARDDPRSFVRHDSRLLVIDEVQKAPGLLPAIKMEVDRDQRPGRYLLTGSAEIFSLPSVTESLAGRVRTIRLRSLTQGEILGRPPTFLERAFDQEFRERESGRGDAGSRQDGLGRDDYLSLALAGGYPGTLGMGPSPERADWHRDYVAELLARDLREVANIRRKAALALLIGRVAAWSSKGLDMGKLERGLEVSRPTLETYINALETLYLVDRVEAWFDSDYARGRRPAKLFMSDSGLMAGELGWTLPRVRASADASGKLLETFVHSQLAPLADMGPLRHELTHYRDTSGKGREVDFLVADSDGNVLGIEVKSARRVSADDARHLCWFGANRAKGRRFIGLVLHTGGKVRQLAENAWAVPISYLWE